MPVAMGAGAERHGGGAVYGGQQQSVEDVLAAAGIRGDVRAQLESLWSTAELADALNQGHTAQSLLAVYDQVRGQQAQAQPQAAQPRARAARQGQAQRARAYSWRDEFVPDLFWTGMAEVLWGVNGLSTVMAVAPAVADVLGPRFALSLVALSPYAPLAVGALASAALYLTLRLSRQPFWQLLLAMAFAGGASTFLAAQTLTSWALGLLVGLLVHLGISKTELVYWRHRGSPGRLLALALAVVLDTTTALQGLINMAYWRSYAWVVGPETGRVPQSVVAWVKTTAATCYARWSWDASLGEPPAYPTWLARALMLMVLCAGIALFSERLKRATERNLAASWARR